MTDKLFTSPRAAVAALILAQARPHWGPMMLRGVAGIAFGVIAMAMPGPTLVSLAVLFAAYMLVDGVFAIAAFVAIAAAWALVSGAFMIIAAFRAAAHDGRWLLGLGGAVSVAWGVLLLVFGITLVVLAFKLRSAEKAAEGHSRTATA